MLCPNSAETATAADKNQWEEKKDETGVTFFYNAAMSQTCSRVEELPKGATVMKTKKK